MKNIFGEIFIEYNIYIYIKCLMGGEEGMRELRYTYILRSDRNNIYL